MRNQLFLIQSDNATTCVYTNKLGGPKSPALCIQLWHVMMWLNIRIVAAYIPGIRQCPGGGLVIQERMKLLDQSHLLTHQDLTDQRDWELNKSVAEALSHMLDLSSIPLL